MVTIQQIRNEFKQKLDDAEYVIDKSGVRLIEIPAAQFLADEEAIFGKPNLNWHERELTWYLQQSLNVNDIISPVPEIWKQVASVDGNINSNYGWCVLSPENGNQYKHVLKELKSFPTSRRAQMIYTRPTMWSDYNRDGMSDFMCTNTVQYLIRNGVLHAIVNMRSNDAVHGYKGDKYWQDYVHNRLAKDLDIPVGPMIWCAGSLHIYERHWNLVV